MPLNTLPRLALAAAASMLPACAALAASPDVVVSIKPLHSLVAAVMDGIGEPHLLVSGADSPHTYAMRPSDAEALSKADVVFWIGEALETFLARPIDNLGHGARTVELLHAPGVTLLEYPRDRDAARDEDEEKHAADTHGTSEPDLEHHHHAGTDPHIWLDPENALAMVAEIASVLSDADPANAPAYARNAALVTGRLQTLETETADALKPYREYPYYTFHDSFRYFDNRFGLDDRGAITISPDRQPGAQRLREIRDEIDQSGHVCIFAEPQFPPKLVEVIVEGTAAHTGTLDPLGAALTPGKDLYFDLIAANREAFARCFQDTM